MQWRAGWSRGDARRTSPAGRWGLVAQFPAPLKAKGLAPYRMSMRYGARLSGARGTARATTAHPQTNQQPVAERGTQPRTTQGRGELRDQPPTHPQTN
ncbi:hypothetical protein GCM10010278_14370 [Streptomyces melanogenes]|nr:hypothetical protein GCM10010278_14370 [Streptomyces melanogenes]